MLPHVGMHTTCGPDAENEEILITLNLDTVCLNFCFFIFLGDVICHGGRGRCHGAVGGGAGWGDAEAG